MQTVEEISSTMIRALGHPKAYKTPLDIQERSQLEAADDFCTRCGGAGFYLPDVPWNHEKFGKAEEGHAHRSWLFDQGILTWMNQHPTGTIIELGAGLETTYYRVDNGSIHWVCSLWHKHFDCTPRP